MVDEELLQLITSPDALEDDNFSRAANLLEYLLKNKLDAVKANNAALMTLEDEENFKQISGKSTIVIKRSCGVVHMTKTKL